MLRQLPQPALARPIGIDDLVEHQPGPKTGGPAPLGAEPPFLRLNSVGLGAMPPAVLAHGRAGIAGRRHRGTGSYRAVAVYVADLCFWCGSPSLFGS